MKKFNTLKTLLLFVSFFIAGTTFGQHCPAGKIEVFFNLTGVSGANAPKLLLDEDTNGSYETQVTMYDADNTTGGGAGTDGWYQCSVCLTENASIWYQYADGTTTWESANLLTAFQAHSGTCTESWPLAPCSECPIRSNGTSFANRFLNLGTSNLNVHETVNTCPSAMSGASFTHHETRDIQVLPSQSGDITATDRIYNSDGWVSFWNDNSTATDFSDDYILLSVKLDNIEHWNTQYNRVKVNAASSGGVAAEWRANDAATFINNAAGGSGRFQRIWSYDWTTALTADAGVRFYYTDADFTSLNSFITGNGGTALNDATEMQLYKVTSNEPAWQIPVLAPADVQMLAHNATNSTTEFSTYSDGAGFNYVEFEVAAFNNRGGGVVGTSSGATALPVELTRFTGELQAQDVLLNWTTASEKENSHFRIEYSLDGREFKAIGEITGRGNSLETTNYEFVHQEPSNGVNYYRLVPVAFDGTEEYSDVVSVAIERDGKLSVFPTLTSNVLNVNYEGSNVDILVYNQLGREVMKQSLNMANGTHQLSVADLANGVYYLIAQSGNTRQTVKFIKQ